MTKKVIKRIIKEYEEGDTTFLCFSSPTFDVMWSQDHLRTKIQIKAIEFLQHHHPNTNFKIGELVLFTGLGYGYVEDKRKLRKEFLQYWLNNCEENL